MKTFKLTVTEDELKALIRHHAYVLSMENAVVMDRYSTETSSRIHDLTKRLNRTTPEIENDPRSATASEDVKIPEGWTA